MWAITIKMLPSGSLRTSTFLFDSICFARMILMVNVKDDQDIQGNTFCEANWSYEINAAYLCRHAQTFR